MLKYAILGALVHATVANKEEPVANKEEPVDAVFVIGVMKSGTTAVCEQLAKHPCLMGVRLTGNEPKHYSKELHYFDVNERWEKGIGFYNGHFYRQGGGKQNVALGKFCLSLSLSL